MVGYYDLLLGLIPVTFVAVTGALIVSGIALTTAVPLGALVSLGLVIHGMFVNGPVDAPTPRQRQSVDRDQPYSSAD